MNLLFGRLGWTDTPFAELIAHPSVNTAVASGAAGLVILGALVTTVLLTRYRLWVPLFRDWLTSVDHKKIGVMYIVLALVMMSRGVAEGAVMRAQQGTALAGGFLSADHFAQLFSTHGTIMIFFVAVPMIVGLINIAVPLQIGARDMAFPVMNQVSLGLTASGAALMMISLVIGQFATGGWTNYPPYTGLAFNPGVGPDYWLWAILISGVGSMLSGINFAVTIYKKRAPGMHYMRMTLFTWTSLCTAIMLIYAMPPLTVSSAMLALDRLLGFHFFTNDLGGNMMNYANIFWMFGHPEVYVLVLPAYGVWSEVASTFSGKTLYGYTSLVLATMAIAVISFTVWLHHFFTMGQSSSVNIAFGIATMVIAVPTGVKVYDWMATLWRGRIRLTVPMIYLLGFFMLFVIGGMTGMILANPSIDYQVHNSTFLVAHFHNVLIPGVLYGVLAGIHYWFPKVFGFRLDERLGRVTAGLWVVGFSLTFFPLYVLGLMGMPRRLPDFDDSAYGPWVTVAGIGALVVLAALAMIFFTFWYSIRHRDRFAVPLGDPWDGRTLEWSVAAPAPEWNFARLPQVRQVDDFWRAKQDGRAYAPIEEYEDIVMPRSTAFGLVIAVASFCMGFGIIWHIWWFAALGFVAIPAAMIFRVFRTDTERTIPAAEVREKTEAWLAAVHAATPVTRDEEDTPANRGRAVFEGNPA
ncbi:cbb3-type cytochrome c oxidase subunit I [Devosia sp. PTR5]|uniref:Cbb3-type cytochrome c oxidase subunit I n=1 Tax=Devosia oryzisoli TaxID=2774138 RepID=A0A927FT72_9HYPH|nr:cbb3-type cytochrome c oxidase subunit I [Devosia oryzisoli]MBD8065825.1 cbb3-type cytochrome c oxidase subunit I [Devosia oryzisoli]